MRPDTAFPTAETVSNGPPRTLDAALAMGSRTCWGNRRSTSSPKSARLFFRCSNAADAEIEAAVVERFNSPVVRCSGRFRFKTESSFSTCVVSDACAETQVRPQCWVGVDYGSAARRNHAWATALGSG